MNPLKPNRPAIAVLLLLATLTIANHSNADCPYDWKPGEGLPGVNGTVSCATTWDPDGPGPAPELLVIGGDFSRVGPLSASYFAAWDGTSWRTLPLGPNGPLWDLAVFGGELIASGSFGYVGPSNAWGFARCDGNAWYPMTPPPSTSRECLLSHNGELFVGGTRQSSTPPLRGQVVRWNGHSWSELGGDLPYTVKNLATYNGEILAIVNVAPGQPDSTDTLYHWNGADWQHFGAGPGGRTLQVTAHGGELFAGGTRDSFRGFASVWDGSGWQSLDNSIRGFVQALAYQDGCLHIGIRHGTPLPSDFVLRWNKGEWEPLGAGVNWDVTSLLTYQGQLIATGLFGFAGGAGALRIAGWDGHTWYPLGNGLNRMVYAFTEFNGDLVAGGNFTSPGNDYTYSVSRRNGQEWVPIGAGFTAPVHALAVHNGELIAGGVFSAQYGSPHEKIARWDGNAWQSLGAGLGEPWSNHSVYALASYGGELIAGGEFFSQTEASGIAHWNGTTWQPYGYGTWGRVTALTIYRGELIAAGSFGSIDTTWTPNIIRWNGSTWRPLGAGINGQLFALAVMDDQLYAGGDLTDSGGTPLYNVARWDGNSWTAVGAGLSDFVFALAILRGELIAGGSFWASTNPATAANCLARWDGVSWQPMAYMPRGTGSFGGDPYVRTLHVRDSELWAGGDFTLINSLTSAYVARWAPTVPPATISNHPSAQSVHPGKTASFSVTATGEPPLTYQWRKNGINLTDDQQISGATTATLTIHPVRPKDLGNYDVIVTNDCRSVTSIAAALTLQRPAAN